MARAQYRTNYQGCLLIRGILYSFHTPQGRAAARLILLDNPALDDCQSYARKNSG